MKMGVGRNNVVTLESEEKGFVECRCKELEERWRKAEARCVKLGLEVGETKMEKTALETIIRALKIEKLDVEIELRNLKRGNEGKVDLNEKREEEDRVLKLMIENNVLECEKKRAEKEAEEWKKKFMEMESEVFLMKKEGEVHGLKVKGSSKEKVANLENEGSLHERGTPYNGTPHKLSTSIKNQSSDEHLSRDLDRVKRVRKHLVFEEDKQLTKKKTPSTSSSAIPTPLIIIDVPDNGDEHDFAKIKTPGALDQSLGRERKLQSNGTSKNVPVISASKRKRPTNVVTSDVESDSDDNVLISVFMNDCSLVSTPTDLDNVKSNKKRRRLIQYEEKDRKEKCSSKEVEDKEPEELGSDSASDSLSGFIVRDDNKLDDVSSGSNTDFSVDFDEILSNLKRDKNRQSKWKLEGEMLAAFGRDDKLCMKAVCALYRQQTKAEQAQKATVVPNKRGFNQFDAFRGSTLAEFLTEGDSQSDVKKSVKELKKHDREGVDVCRTLATRYSKQLFEIYEKKEDPYLRP